MCDMCRVENAFKEAETTLNRTVDLIALKKLQATVYDEMDWLDEVQELLEELEQMTETEKQAGMCTCKHGTMIIGGENHGTCGECGKPTTDE